MEDLDQFFETLAAKASRISELQQQFKHDSEEIKEVSNELVNAVDSLPPNDSLTKIQRSMLLYYKGKGLSSLDTYDKRAEDNLSKCLKLSPKHLESWICLGEVFYQKRDFV
jgi:tetratricopeptide (TPR) repeat protein